MPRSAFKSFHETVKSVGLAADFSGFVEVDNEGRTVTDGRTWVAGIFGMVTIFLTILYSLFILSQRVYRNEVSLCQCSLFQDQIIFGSFTENGTLNQYSYALNKVLNTSVEGEGTIRAFTGKGYLLAEMCPWHNTGSVCSAKCLEEIEIENELTKKLKNPYVGRRVCPIPPGVPDNRIDEYVTCYRDINPCDKIGGPVEFLQMLGSTWGFVSLFVIIVIIAWNTSSKIYARRKRYRTEMTSLKKRMSRQLTTLTRRVENIEGKLGIDFDDNWKHLSTALHKPAKTNDVVIHTEENNEEEMADVEKPEDKKADSHSSSSDENKSADEKV